MKRWMLALLCLMAVCALIACGQSGEEADQEEAVATVLSWQEQYDLGMKYLSEGNYEEAVIAFTAAIALEPKEAIVYLGRAEAYMNYVELDDGLALALADYETVISLDPANPEGYLGLAEVYIAQGDFDAAMAILEQGLGAVEDGSALQGKLDELNSGSISDFWGNLRKMSYYDGAGALSWYHIYDFENGKQSMATSYDAGGSMTSQVAIFHDDAGNQTQTFWYSFDDGAMGKIEYEYDGNGNCIKENHYDEEGTLNAHFVLQYEGDTLVSEIQYTFDGEKVATYTYSYGENGNKRMDVYWHDDDSQYYQLWEYDDDGNTVRYGQYDLDGTPWWYVIYNYDDEGNRISNTEYDGDGNITATTTYN